MRSIVKKNSIFIIAVLNLVMFIISFIVFYWSGYIRDQYNIMNDGEYFDTFYLFCIVIIEIFVFSLQKSSNEELKSLSLVFISDNNITGSFGNVILLIPAMIYILYIILNIQKVKNTIHLLDIFFIT